MAGPLFADRVRETSTTTGTGTLNLAGAVTGYRTFVAGVGTGNTCYYCIEAVDSDGVPSGDWEVGLGTVTDAGTDTLSRTTILASSNAGAAVNLAAGTKNVFQVFPAAMASPRSGQTLCRFKPQNNEPPSTAYATLDLRNVHPVLDFDAATDEEAVFTDILPASYGGGGLTVVILWAATSATSGNCIWDAQFDRLADGGQDIDSAGFAAVQSVTAATSGTSGILTYSSITFTSGAAMDSLAAGELFRLKVRRDANNASDTMTGDAELRAVLVKET